MSTPTLVVMAAGMGSRYGGLKQLDAVGPHGQVILDYSVYDAYRAGFERVVFVIKPEIEAAFRERVGERIARKMDARYVFQTLEDLPAGYSAPEGRVKPWGTCHAVLAARGEVDGPFAVINADDRYGPEGFRGIYEHFKRASAGEYCMAGYLLGNTLTENGSVARGVCETDSEGRLVSVTERTRIEKTASGARYTEDGGASWTDIALDSTVSMNLWGFTRDFMDEAWTRFPAFLDRTLRENPLKGEYFLPGVVTQLLEEGRASVRVLRTRDRWYGVTYKEDRASVTAAFGRLTEEGVYPEELWA
ncbi:MAG TPA: nucleotidyltransferase [Candidatus Scatomorpha merdipullorum]|uniref:Nucleotidyltransferase n=1 Tax=Candidatus Scatomorpha merdipullorum TaxID=2840927 RepID=A0A9D1JWT8_9FIRM|nr:nucleotidyltransferase [Candidatus Scatomorpha merdipullorum]